jgi:ABC-2 type transport system permease protein
MTGLVAFLQKELMEIRRTWRIWVIPGMLVFFGITSPIVAALTPALLRSMAATQPGVVIQLPPPTAFDAAAQFLKNLNQFILIAIVIAGAGTVSGERTSGTAILVLTKPLSRATFVLAKILSEVMVLLVATALGTAACLAMTAVVFDASATGRLITAVSLWLLVAILVVVVMTLFSTTFRSRGAAAGAGLAFYFLMLLFSTWAPAARYTFLGLLPGIRDALTGQHPTFSLGVPVVAAVATILFASMATVFLFERQEL